MTPKYRPILWRPQKNIHKIFIPPQKIIFLKTPKNIEIQNFEPPKITRAYVCIKISEYPPPLIKLLRKSKIYFFSQAVARYGMIYLSLYEDVVMMSSGKNEFLLQFFFNE